MPDAMLNCFQEQIITLTNKVLLYWGTGKVSQGGLIWWFSLNQRCILTLFCNCRIRRMTFLSKDKKWISLFCNCHEWKKIVNDKVRGRSNGLTGLILSVARARTRSGFGSRLGTRLRAGLGPRAAVGLGPGKINKKEVRVYFDFKEL